MVAAAAVVAAAVAAAVAVAVAVMAVEVDLVQVRDAQPTALSNRMAIVIVILDMWLILR